MDGINTYGRERNANRLSFKIWTCDEAQNQNLIPKSLPPVEEISRFLQCCRCMDLVSLLLYPKENAVCLKSHSICRDCMVEVNVCQFQYSNGKICNQPFVKMPEGHMNIFDFLRHESQIYCPYWNVGCKEIVIGRSLEFHLEKECAFRPLSSCVYTGCSMKRIVMSDLVNHIEYDHGVHVEVNKSFKAQIDLHPEGGFKTGDDQSVLVLLECYDSHFIIVMHETRDKYFIWALQCPFLDTITISNRLEYISRIEIFDRFQFVSKNIRQLAEVWEPSGICKMWDFPVHSIYRPIEEIIHLGQCFEFPKQTLADNGSFYLGTRKDGTRFWRMEISILEANPKCGVHYGTMPADLKSDAFETENNNAIASKSAIGTGIKH